MKSDNGTSLLQTVLVALLLGLALAFFVTWIPYDFDEFVVYRPIICGWYPGNRVPQMLLPCGSQDLSIFGLGYLPLRAFEYVGSITSLVYFPLFLVWPSPHSVRLFGILLVGLQGFLVARMFRLPLLATVLGLTMFLQYSFQVVVDTGQLSLMTTIIIAIELIQRGTFWQEGSRKRERALATLAIGALVFLGVWIKLSFLFVLPSLAILGLARVVWQPSGELRQRRFGHGLVSLMIAAALSMVLLSGVARNGESYWSYLTASESSGFVGKNVALLKVKETILPFLLNPLRTAHVPFQVSEEVSSLGLGLGALITGLLLFGLTAMRSSRERSFLIVQILGFVLVVGWVTLSERAWAMHHLVMGFPFLILALGEVFSRLKGQTLARVLFASFLVLNLAAFYQLTEPRRLNTTKRGLIHGMAQFNDYLNRFGDKYTFVVVGYGLSHLKALYGAATQAVVYTHRLDSSDDFEELSRVISHTERPPMFVVRLDRPQQFLNAPKFFGELQAVTPPLKTTPWAVLVPKNLQMLEPAEPIRECRVEIPIELRLAHIQGLKGRIPRPG